MAPKAMTVRAVPKGVVLQVRNVLTSLVDIGGRPGVPLLDLLLDKAVDPGERARLTEIRDVLATPGGPDSPLRAAIEAGGYDVLRLLDEFPSCSLNIFEFLRVAQPLRPRYYSASSSPRVHGDGRRPADRRARGHAGAGRAARSAAWARTTCTRCAQATG